MDAREIKGMQIAATTPLRKTKDAWLVPSQSGPGNYRVASQRPAMSNLYEVSDLACTCPDYELRQRPCKHVIAVEYVIRREYSSQGDVVTETMRVTYTQDWAAYNAAQCEEKDRFMPMLADLCSTIPQPPQGRGRPRLPMSDMAFEAVSRVYSGLSARRFDSDVREAQAKGLTDSDPHFNSVLRYLRDPEMTPVLKSLVTLSALPLKAVETDFAVDSTGFTTCRFVRWYDHKWGKEKSKREWIKLHAMTGVRTNIVTAVETTHTYGPDSSDYNQFIPLLAGTAENFTFRDVTADKAYSGRTTLGAVEDFGGTPYIPFRGDFAGLGEGIAPHLPTAKATTWTKMFHLFAYQRDTFLSHYSQRSNVETTFSMIKRKFGDSLRSKSEVGQMNEVLCKVIAHNLCVLIAAVHEMKLEFPRFSDRIFA
ncbi:MAG: transposase [Acidimicrobiales bacterium]|jgi:transposase